MWPDTADVLVDAGGLWKPQQLVSFLWRRPTNIHGFALDGKSYRQGLAAVPAICGVRLATLLLRTCNLTTIACDKWSLVTN